MDIINDKILVYGIGDEGFGTIHYKKDYRQYEQSSGGEEGKKAVAKVALLSNFAEDGFIWKVGGYTVATNAPDGAKRKTDCYLVS